MEKVLASSTARKRPLSPHLSIWKWGPHMLVSILHRVSGDGLAIVGGIALIWWLVAAASGAGAYADFLAWVAWKPFGIPLALIISIGLTWAFFEHMFSGIRHLFLDTGAGYELTTNKTWSIVVVAAAILATFALWMFIAGRAL